MEIKILPFCIKRKEAKNVAASVEARLHLETIVGRTFPGSPLKVVFAWLAHKLRVSIRRIETMWRGTARITAEEMDRLRALAAAKTAFEESHASRLDRHADRLEAVDHDFYRAEIDRLRGQADQLRNLVD